MKMIVWFVFVLGALSAAAEVFIAKVGQEVTLNCGVSSYRRSVMWRRGDDLLFAVDQRGFTRKGVVDLVRRSFMKNVNLKISGVRETDAGKFTCETDGSLQEHSLVVVSVSASASPSDVLQLGSEATLQCDVKGLAEGYEVKWKSPNAGSPEGTSTAHLKPVTSLHDGTWQCIITYGSKQLSESLTIRVKEPPPTPATTPLSSLKNITLFVTDDQKTACAKCTANDGPLGISCCMWLAMGVCCLFGILLMLCVLVCVNVFCKGDRKRPWEERHSSNLYV